MPASPYGAPIMFDLPQGPNINLLTQPLQQGLQTYRQGMDKQFQGERELKQEQQADERLNMAKQQAAEARQDRMMKSFGNMALAVVNEPDEAKANAYFQHMATIPGLVQAAHENGIDLTDHRGAARLMAARAGVLPDPLDQQAKRAQIAASQSSTAMHNATLAQLKTQTPEYRAKVAPQFGLQPGTPEHTQFVISGTYAPKADTFDLEEGKTRYQQVRQPDGSYKVAPVVSAPPKIDATTRKEIQESDDFIAQTQTALGALNEAIRLNSQAYHGPVADYRAGINNALPFTGKEGSSATVQLQNVVTNQALQSLRATFGGNPTEGERKILLDVAGSVNMNAADREQIYRRAIAMAKQRLLMNQQKAKSLRSGTYYNEAGQPPAVNQPVDLTPQRSFTQPGVTAPRQRYVNPGTGQTIEWNGSQWIQVE